MKILMVCLGNICRSPLAEGIMGDMIKKNGLNWQVDSAGTGNYHIGEAPHHLSQKVARMNGVDISQQKCRQFRADDMQAFDLIYVMDQQNYADVKRMSGTLFNEAKTALILSEIKTGSTDEVPDPWYGTEKDYHHVYDLLTAACQQIINKYNHQLSF